MISRIKIEEFLHNNHNEWSFLTIFLKVLGGVDSLKKWLFILLLSALVTGCGGNQANEGDTRQEQQPINVRNSTAENIDRQSGQEISRHLVELATSIPNVNDATAVVLGNYAIVGIDVNEDLERSDVGAIKYSVAESLKKDPHGARAVVVADPDMTARLREISEDIQNGKPVQGIVNELADISGRLMPEVPADIIDPDTKENTVNKPDNKLNNQEKQQLDKEQKKQSNHHLNPNSNNP